MYSKLKNDGKWQRYGNYCCWIPIYFQRGALKGLVKVFKDLMQALKGLHAPHLCLYKPRRALLPLRAFEGLQGPRALI